MPNVFISHRASNLDCALKLAGDLRIAGHQVWLDEWNIALADSIVQRINEGLTGSHFVVLCCSSEGVDSLWMSREWMSSLARQLNGESIKIIPVLFSGAKVPPILADIKYLDLSVDWTKGIARLIAVLS